MHVGDDIRTRHARDDANRAGTAQTQGPDLAPTLHAPRRSSVELEPVTNLTTTSATTTTTSVSVQGSGAQVLSEQDSALVEARSERSPARARQSPQRVYRALRAVARQGNPDAQADLALCYVEGRGVEKSRNKAAKWFKQAAEQGNSFAQAWCLWHGSGTKRNLAAAVELYMLSAAGGNTDAMWRLGLCYERGWCVSSDPNIALQMFQMAATKGNVDGQFHLARSYYHGIGTPKSKMEAVYWFALSEGAVASAAAQPMRLLELLEQALRDFETSLQEEVLRIERYLARTRAREPEPEDAPAPSVEQEPASGHGTGDSPDHSDGEPAGRAADPGASPPAQADQGLPRLQEVSEPSSTPSTESGPSGDGDEVDEADEVGLEWQADLKKCSTFS